MKTVPEPARFLVESGLLFEINRTLLHPLGLALFATFEEGSHGYELGGIADFSREAGGVVFSDEALEEGRAKLAAFMAAAGAAKHKARKGRLGFVVQGAPDRE